MFTHRIHYHFLRRQTTYARIGNIAGAVVATTLLFNSIGSSLALSKKVDHNHELSNIKFDRLQNHILDMQKDVKLVLQKIDQMGEEYQQQQTTQKQSIQNLHEPKIQVLVWT